MTMNELAQTLGERAEVLLKEGHSTLDIMKSAFADFTALGSMTGVMTVMTTGKLSPQQLELAKRIVVKTLAVIDRQENNPLHPGIPPED